jgi:hypothetical protein
MAARYSDHEGTVYRDRDRIVKRAKCASCERIGAAAGESRAGVKAVGSPPQPESTGQKHTAVAQALLVDAVADA